MTFESNTAYHALHQHFQQRVCLHEPLARHSAFGVGGPADLWLTLETREELCDLINLCGQQRWPLLLVGDGSNILYADAGVRGIVASIAFRTYHLEEQTQKNALLVAEAGVRWKTLLPELAMHGWGGLEFGIGIPGTLGAGVVSNAGIRNQQIGQVLEWVEVLDARACNRIEAEEQLFPVMVFRRYPHDALDLGYHYSRFREQRLTQIDAEGNLVLPVRGLIEPPELILTLALHLHRQDTSTTQTLLHEGIQERQKHDPQQRHLGAIFQDPPQITAGDLIAQVGLAGRMYGQAQISERNANYIINRGGATATEISTLIREAHQQVLMQKGLHLALNLELVGAW